MSLVSLSSRASSSSLLLKSRMSLLLLAVLTSTPGLLSALDTEQGGREREVEREVGRGVEREVGRGVELHLGWC